LGTIRAARIESVSANKPKRQGKTLGGCLIDVPTGGVITRGLSMPHSPRWHDGRLWLLESGTGRLVVMAAAGGRCEAVAELPGFARGLAAHGPYAFIGLSKIRETSAMDGVPLAARRGELKCGVAAVDLRSGRVVGLLEFQTAVEEIFDVQLLVGARFPEVIGFQQETLSHTFVVPDAGSPAPGGSESLPDSPPAPAVLHEGRAPVRDVLGHGFSGAVRGR